MGQAASPDGAAKVKWLPPHGFTGKMHESDVRVGGGYRMSFTNFGTGNGHYSDRKPAFTKQDVVLRKEGCGEETYSFKRNERLAFGAVIGAYYLVLPAMWFLKYKPHRAYEFECRQAMR